MSQRRSFRMRASLTSQSDPSPPRAMSRSRRTTSGRSDQSITVARDPSHSPEGVTKSIRLTVKMPSSKLREATSGSRRTAATKPREAFEPGPIVTGPRGTRAKRTVVVESGSDDEDEEADEEDEEGQDEDDEDDEQEEEDEEHDEEHDEEEDAEGEDENVAADSDIEMEDEPVTVQPPPPFIKMTGPSAKPTVKVITPTQSTKLKSVEDKEVAEEDDDEELSELDTDAEGEQGDGGDEDGEGEELDDEDQEMDQDDDEDLVSDGETPAAGSRASTPDITKMTKRQRSRLDQVMGSDFLQLPMEPQIKKHLTAEEHAMRRSEMARRRKNLSEKRNEEEKMDTINRLLKKQAPKRRGKISAAETTSAANADGKASTPNDQTELDEIEYEKPNPVFVRWVSTKQGTRIGVPEEWIAAPLGKILA
ncbi:hypothetical protein MMC09_003665 [Bachmanniomyces sp. S44760]|nr:hypothetical protein [Bachmanniomyces sp. S44760]